MWEVFALLALVELAEKAKKMSRGSRVIRKIVTVNPEAGIEACETSIKNIGGRIIKQLPLVDGYLCEFPDNVDPAVTLLENDQFLHVDDDIKVKILQFSWWDLLFPVSQPRQTPSWGYKRIHADQVLKSAGKTIKVGIIDTGIDRSHPDLSRNIKGGVNIINKYSTYQDDNGHGTNCAGIIGALNNNIGVIGICPNVEIYAIKTMNSKGEGSLSDIITGLQWCIDNDIKIVNLSFGTSQDNATFRRAFKKAAEAGLIMVAAAGNDGAYGSVKYPAKYPEVIAVSATTEKDELAEFSSWGPEVDLAAPGKDILTTAPGGTYKKVNGTSFAAPHVTGVIARVFSEYGYMPFETILKRLQMSAEELPNLEPEKQGAGLVNAAGAIKRWN